MPVVLFLSRLVENKGPGLVIDAAGLLRSRGTPLRLVIAGDGKPGYVAALRRRAAQAGVSDGTTFTGHVNGAAKVSLYQASSVFVLPTIHENFGFSARHATPDVLLGPVAHMIYTEDERYIRTTNRHFTVTVSDATYRRMKDEVIAWRDAPGRYYDLDTRNCIHFVGRMAQLAGLQVDYPKKMLRKPKAWLNHIAALNPQLGARLIR